MSQHRPRPAAAASRGANLHPNVPARGGAGIAAPTHGGLQTSQVSQFVPPPRRPTVAFQIVQQCQEFLYQMAWREVR
jgi:hypothetical protein